MPSVRFRQTEKEINILGRELLPKSFNPLGNYPNSIRIRTRAYLLLVHAEFESYIEQEAKRIARKSEDVFGKTGRITRPLAYLIASNGLKLGRPASARNTIEQEMSELVATVYAEYYRRVRTNHGIKEENVVSLFDPLGVPDCLYSPILMSQLDSFGADRGEQAHYSSAMLQNVLDPATEHDRVVQILTELKDFDAKLRVYERQVR